MILRYLVRFVLLVVISVTTSDVLLLFPPFFFISAFTTTKTSNSYPITSSSSSRRKGTFKSNNNHNHKSCQSYEHSTSIIRTEKRVLYMKNQRNVHDPMEDQSYISQQQSTSVTTTTKQPLNTSTPFDQQRRALSLLPLSLLLWGSGSINLVTKRYEHVPSAANAAAAEISSGMKSFIDPLGLFFVTVPERFYTVRRTAKGDLPDEKTGKGRRGSSIFTAGDMAKAEIVAIERFPIRALLEENGIDPTVGGGSSITTFPDLGESSKIATLIMMRREKEKQTGQLSTTTQLVRESIQLTDDGTELYYQLRTSIPVQKPELLLEQTGQSELVRITLVKSSLKSNDGNLMSIYASALQDDYYNSNDGTLLQQTVNSFQPTNQAK